MGFFIQPNDTHAWQSTLERRKKTGAEKKSKYYMIIDAKALDNPYNVKKLRNLAMMLVMLVQGCWSTSRMSTKTCFETDPSRPERPPMKQVQNDTEFCQDVSPMRSTHLFMLANVALTVEGDKD